METNLRYYGQDYQRNSSIAFQQNGIELRIGDSGARTFSCIALKISNQRRLFISGGKIWILQLRQRASPEDAKKC